MTGDAWTRWGRDGGRDGGLRPSTPQAFAKSLTKTNQEKIFEAFQTSQQDLFFLRFFQKADAAPARVRWSPSAESETPLSFQKRHGGVIFAAGENRGTTQVGGSP